MSGARYVELETAHFMASQTPALIADTLEGFLDSIGA